MVKQALLYGPHKTYRYCCGSLYMEMFVGKKKKSNLVPWKLQVTLPKNNLRHYSVRDGGLPLKNCMVLTICRYLWSSPKYFLWKRRVDWQRVCWSFEQIWAMGIVDMADHESAHTPTYFPEYTFILPLDFRSSFYMLLVLFKFYSWHCGTGVKFIELQYAPVQSTTGNCTE